MNQHTNQQIEIPCYICGTTIPRYNSKCNTDKPVCSNKCKGVLFTKWKDADYEYVKENFIALGYDCLAKHFNVSADAMKRQISKWRNEGKQIPYLKRKVIGDTKLHSIFGYIYLMVKTENGWRKKECLHKPDKKEKNQKAPKTTSKQVSVSPRKQVSVHKKEVVKFETKIIDKSDYEHIRIDSRTHVLRKKILK